MENSDKTYSYDPHPMRVQELPRSQQPRELVEQHGPENVQDEVLIAVLLRTGLPNLNVVELSRNLLRHYGSLTEMGKASVEELQQHPGMGPVKAQLLKCALEMGRRLSREGRERSVVRSPDDVLRLLGAEASGLDREHFWVILLDTRYRLLRPPRVVTRGILNASLVHAREVFKEALAASSAAIIVAHNHPSGDTTPSAEDIRVTRKLVDAGKIMGIDVLDHVVLGQDETNYTSLRESGLVAFD